MHFSTEKLKASDRDLQEWEPHFLVEFCFYLWTLCLSHECQNYSFDSSLISRNSSSDLDRSKTLVLNSECASKACFEPSIVQVQVLKMITCKILARYGAGAARRGASRAPPPITVLCNGSSLWGRSMFCFQVVVLFFAAIHTFINNLPGPIHVLHL